MHDATRKTISMVREKIQAVSNTYQELMTTCQHKRNLFIVCVRFHMNMRQVGPIYMNLWVCVLWVCMHTRIHVPHTQYNLTHMHTTHTPAYTPRTHHTHAHTHTTHMHTHTIHPHTYTLTHTHTHTTPHTTHTQFEQWHQEVLEFLAAQPLEEPSQQVR